MSTYYFDAILTIYKTPFCFIMSGLLLFFKISVSRHQKEWKVCLLATEFQRWIVLSYDLPLNKSHQLPPYYFLTSASISSLSDGSSETCSSFWMKPLLTLKAWSRTGFSASVNRVQIIGMILLLVSWKRCQFENDILLFFSIFFSNLNAITDL